MYDFYDYKINNPSKNKNLNVIYAAGLIGKLILKALNQKNIKVDFYCDGDAAKWDTEIENTKVISPENLSKFDKNVNIFIGTYQFDAIIPILEKMGQKNFYNSIGLLTDDFLQNYNGNILNEYNITNKKLLRIMEYYNKTAMKPEYIVNRKLIIKTLDVQITEKCSLKCKDCSNLMQYYKKPKDSDINILFKSSIAFGLERIGLESPCFITLSICSFGFALIQIV